MRRAAMREPSASRSPRPWRRAIRFTISTMAGALPKVSSSPSVSSLVISPFSKQSMATAMVHPQVMVSIP